MIDLTPLEVRKKKGDFRRTMRGYDPLLVDDFLDLVADRLEELVRENLALQESAGRQEQQVTDYRDREKALTEALVSAQEMREEVRRQAAREAEQALESARREAAELRAAVEEESRQLRDAASREREEARRERDEALREIAQLRAELEADSQRLLTETRQAASETAAAAETGAPEAVPPGTQEERLRQLYVRQEELIANYRGMLERELAQLSALARGLGTPPGAEVQEPEGGPRAAPPRAAASGPGVPATPEAPADVSAGDELTESDVAEEAALALGVTPEPLLEFEGEPFEPEPFLPEDDEQEAFAAEDVADAYREERSAAPEGETDVTEVAGGGLEARLYEGIAADESGDGVPGPIGLGEPEEPAPSEEPAPWEEPWTLAPAPSDDVFDLDDADLPDAEEDDDPETAALLRNAAAAGYRLSDEDIPEEAKSDEPATEGDEENADDDGWLPGLLDDDRE